MANDPSRPGETSRGCKDRVHKIGSLTSVLQVGRPIFGGQNPGPQMELVDMATLDPDRYQLFRDRLREARLEAELTQLEVSLALKRHPSFISRCETGERRVDFVEAEILARFYKKTLSFFSTEPRPRKSR